MLGQIEQIVDNKVTINLNIDIFNQTNLIGLHVIFDDLAKKVVGVISNVSKRQMDINILGEFINNVFVPGSSAKPSFKSKVRLIKLEELEKVLGVQNLGKGYTNFGYSTVYQNYKINVNVNSFFSNHFSILGNSGSGKSCTVASIIQKLFTSSSNPPLNSNIFLFDAFGEYTNAFSKLSEKNSNIRYKTYTTNTKTSEDNLIRIPIWLLDVDDLALLLDVTTPNQLPIIEKALKLVPILSGNTDSTIKYKNDIIARALEDILLSGAKSTKIRDQVIAVLTKFNTEELNLETKIVQPGYVRSLKQCLYIDKSGKFQEIELVTEFIRSYIDDTLRENNDDMEFNTMYYTLKDLEEAMEFALISEGVLKSEKVYDNANVLSVRLHNLASGEYKDYFDYPTFVTKEEYIKNLVYNTPDKKKAQIINFNINYVDDRIAKVITKIISRILFNIAVEQENRGNTAYHIIIEEAHRYVQKDKDIDILGYNIFERITKEGRKYGVFLGLITQRPSELSDTAISQCSNFIILRTLHPKDLEYIKEMVPDISMEIVEQLKNLRPGNCIAFGSAFKIPVSMYVELPDPTPNSNNVNLQSVWY